MNDLHAVSRSSTFYLDIGTQNIIIVIKNI